jgi:hypothetical protein
VIPRDSKVGLVRKFAAIVLASAFVVSVAACSDLPAEVQNCTPAYSTGTAVKSISAHGVFGADPKAHVPTPVVAKTVQVSTLKAGKGLLLGKNDIADVSLTLYTGSDGASQGTTGYTRATEVQLAVGDSSTALPTVFAKALTCERVGSRVATVLTAAQFYGSAKKATAADHDPKTVLVAITDIKGGYRGRAVGTLQPLQSGFPSVVTAPDGTPGLTLDLQEPPKTAQHELVRGGSGAKVVAGQKVLLQVQAVAWTDPAPNTTFDTTWTTHAPRYYTLTALTKNAGGQFLDASSVNALVGQRIGSQVLVVVPPKDGYPADKAPTGYPTDGTLIFVYDILGTY